MAEYILNNTRTFATEQVWPGRNGQQLVIGFEGELNARPLKIHIEGLMSRWPDTTPTLIAKRHGETDQYIVNHTSVTNGVLIWTPDAYDTGIAGTGMCQVLMMKTDGSIVAWSDDVKCIVRESLGRTDAQAPEVSPWMTDVINAKDDAIDAKDSAEESAESAETYAGNASQSATSAQASAVNASASATSALASAESASESATEAEDALQELEELIESGDFSSVHWIEEITAESFANAIEAYNGGKVVAFRRGTSSGDVSVIWDCVATYVPDDHGRTGWNRFIAGYSAGNIINTYTFGDDILLTKTTYNIPTTHPDKEFDELSDMHVLVRKNLVNKLASKQNSIQDLEAIRSGAQLATDNISNINDRLDGIDTSLTEITESLDDKADSADVEELERTAVKGVVSGTHNFVGADGVADLSPITDSLTLTQMAVQAKQDAISDLSTIRANASDVPQLKSDVLSQKENIATLDNKVETLEDAGEGRLYTSTATSGSGTQTVPDGSLCRAIVKEWDGKTVVQDGQLVSADVSAVKSVGLNQWDEQWRAGNYNISTGAYQSWASQVCSKNYIPAKPNTTYKAVFESTPPANTSVYACWYKADKTFCGYDGTASHYRMNNGAVSPSDAAYMMFYATAEYGTSYDIGISIVTSATEYTPYTSDTHTIPSSVRTSYPLRSAGDVHDSISFDGAKWWHTKRVGADAVDGAYPVLSTPVVTDITSLMGWDASIAVESGGTVEFVNQQLLSVDNVVEYKVGKSVVSTTQLNEAIATVTKDVQINGTSVKDADGVANIPIASQNGLGVSQYLTSNGIVANNGKPYINAASNQNIDKRTTDRVCIMPRNINYAVTAALTDSNHLTMTSAQQDTACNTIGAERKLADGWVLKGTITDTNGISVDLAGCAELAIFGVAVVTDNTSIMSNVGRLSYNCLKTNAKAVLLMYEDSVWGFCCTHAKSANSTTPVTMADNSAGDSKVDGSKVADINSIYFTDPTNVTSCNIKIYAR